MFLIKTLLFELFEIYMHTHWIWQCVQVTAILWLFIIIPIRVCYTSVCVCIRVFIIGVAVSVQEDRIKIRIYFSQTNGRQLNLAYCYVTTARNEFCCMFCISSFIRSNGLIFFLFSCS